MPKKYISIEEKLNKKKTHNKFWDFVSGFLRYCFVHSIIYFGGQQIAAWPWLLYPYSMRLYTFIHNTVIHTVSPNIRANPEQTRNDELSLFRNSTLSSCSFVLFI